MDGGGGTIDRLNFPARGHCHFATPRTPINRRKRTMVKLVFQLIPPPLTRSKCRKTANFHHVVRDFFHVNLPIVIVAAYRQVVVPDGGASPRPGYPPLFLSSPPISVRCASRNMNGMLPATADVRERRRLSNGMGR